MAAAAASPHQQHEHRKRQQQQQPAGVEIPLGCKTCATAEIKFIVKPGDLVRRGSLCISNQSNTATIKNTQNGKTKKKKKQANKTKQKPY